MTTTEMIQKAYTSAKGKSTAPSSNKYSKLLAIANLSKDDWVNEPGVDWSSLYGLRPVATVITAGLNTYALPTTIRKISQRDNDYIYITTISGIVSKYYLIAPDQISFITGSPAVTKQGRNLVFNTTFPTGDPRIGGTITVPSYGYLPDLVNTTDPILIDNPNWLVYMTAAEFIRNDLTKQNQYGNLIAKANDLMASMKQDNDGTVNTVSMPVWSASLGETWI